MIKFTPKKQFHIPSLICAALGLITLLICFFNLGGMLGNIISAILAGGILSLLSASKSFLFSIILSVLAIIFCITTTVFTIMLIVFVFKRKNDLYLHKKFQLIASGGSFLTFGCYFVSGIAISQNFASSIGDIIVSKLSNIGSVIPLDSLAQSVSNLIKNFLPPDVIKSLMTVLINYLGNEAGTRIKSFIVPWFVWKLNGEALTAFIVVTVLAAAVFVLSFTLFKTTDKAQPEAEQSEQNMQ